MAAYDDLDLQSLFVAEIDDRGARLADGARRLSEGPIEAELLETMVREGHTIKGTARMMGYTAVSDAAKLLEDGWRLLRDGHAERSPELADALTLLTREMAGAIAADPATGTPGLASGMRALRLAMQGLEPSEVESEPDADVGPLMTNADLNGLLGTIGSLGFGDNVRVDAASLYRLINDLCSLRVDTEALSAGLDGASADADGGALRRAVAELEALVVALQERSVDLAAMRLDEITATYNQLIRYVARRAGKEIRLEIMVNDIVADRQVVERLSDPLRHLLVNAVQHGIETVDERRARGKPSTGTISLVAEVTDHRLQITIEDDGRGVDWGAVRSRGLSEGRLDLTEADDLDMLQSLLFADGFSTTAGDLASDGAGLAIVASAVETLQGTLSFESSAAGTRVVLTVPQSRALQDALIVSAAGQSWGIPAISVLGIVDFPQADHLTWEDREVPVVPLTKALGLRSRRKPSLAVVVSTTAGPIGFGIDADLGTRQVAARELGPIVSGVPHLTGAALLGGGDVIVLVDPTRLAERARVDRSPSDAAQSRVLVVDDSRGARQVVGGVLGSAGFEVELAGSPTEALTVLADTAFDAIVLDYLMPTMDGATLAERIRELGIETPIVMLSGVATHDDAVRALDSGANAYLDKDDVRTGVLAEMLRDLTAAA